MNLDLDTLQKILQLGTDHKYVAIVIIVIGWLTSLTSDWSKFPITVPGRYQPLVAAGLGIVFGVLQKIDGGMPWWKAIVGGLLIGLATGGLYDVVIRAVFDGNVPKWLAWLSFARKPDLFDGKATMPPTTPKR